MTGLDTNVLVRTLVTDTPRQSAAAKRAILEAARSGEKLAIQPVTLCELVWVLESCYRRPRAEITLALEAILRTAQFEIIDKDTVTLAVGDYAKGKGDFADYYIGRANERAGADVTLTFDKSLKSDPRFRLLKA